MLEEIQTVFNSTIKALDVLYVIEDLKPVSRIMVKEDEYQKTKEFLKINNLKYQKSDFKVEKIDSTDYSDKGSTLPLNSEKKGHFFIYISKSEELAKKAKGLEKKGDHYKLGIALGYPECCSRFFEKNFPIESKANNDYVFPALNNSKGFQFPFYTNIIARHLDLNLISHFPCNFQCSHSVDIAKKNLECINKNSNELGLIFEGMLKCAIIYQKNRDIFLLRGIKLDDNKLFYDGIMSSINNQLFQKLKNNKFIEIIDKNNIKMKEQELNDIGFMVFE